MGNVKDAFEGTPKVVERWRITYVSDEVLEGGRVVVYVNREKPTNEGFGWETIPRRRIGKGGLDSLKGKVITIERQTNDVGTSISEIVSVRKPR